MSNIQQQHITQEPIQITLEGRTMGTGYYIKYIDNQNIKNIPSPQEIKMEIDGILNIVNQQMSTYVENSQISQFNHNKAINQFIPIADDFASVVKEAIRIHKLTDGGLNVTVGRLVNLWGFGPSERILSPSLTQIKEVQKSVGMDKLQIKKENNMYYLSKQHPELYLDLSSIAKGFGIDKVADYFHHIGVENYLIEIGGELRVHGVNLLGQVWVVGIEKPQYPHEYQLTFPLKNAALATSGSYLNYFENDKGQLISHVIDPYSLQPCQTDILSISVIADTTMTADGTATGLYVQGADKALAIAERENLAVFINQQTNNGLKILISTEFKRLLQSD